MKRIDHHFDSCWFLGKYIFNQLKIVYHILNINYDIFRNQLRFTTSLEIFEFYSEVKEYVIDHLVGDLNETGN